MVDIFLSMEERRRKTGKSGKIGRTEGEKTGRMEEGKGGQGRLNRGLRGLCIGLTEEETEFSRKHSVSCSTLGWVERLKANDN